MFAGQSLQIDPMPAAVERDFEPIVSEAFTHHACAHPGVIQEIDSPPFEQTSSDARTHVLARLTFEHHGIDTMAVQDLREHQPGRAGAHDGDLGFHADMKTPLAAPGGGMDNSIANLY